MKFRRLFGWTEISEDQTLDLKRWIGPLNNGIGNWAVIGFGGRFQNPAVDVEQPAMIAATDPKILDAPVFEGGTPMTTFAVQQTHPARMVTKYDQVLAHDSDGEWQVSKLAGQCDWMPEAPQVFPFKVY